METEARKAAQALRSTSPAALPSHAVESAASAGFAGTTHRSTPETFANTGPSTSQGRDAARMSSVKEAAVAASVSFNATGSPSAKRTASKTGVVQPNRPAGTHGKGPARISRPSPSNAWGTANSAKEVLSVANTGSAGRGTLVPRTLATIATDTPVVSFPFDVHPPQIVFDAFEANRTYTATLELKNHTTTNAYVRVERPSSSTAFVVSAPHGAETSSKVAPGLTVTYTITFAPTSGAQDFMTELVLRTENAEPVTVPVRAYASRGLLQLPATLTLREAPINGSSSTPFFLRNPSSQTCIWRAMIFDSDRTGFPLVDAEGTCCSLTAFKEQSCQVSSSFSIEPTGGALGPLCGSDSATAVTVAPVTLHFHPCPDALNASRMQDAVLRFFLGRDGDVVQDVQLSAQAVVLTGIVLEQQEVTFADTYVTTERQAVVRLRNDSNETIHFAWKGELRSSGSNAGDVAVMEDVQGVTSDTVCLDGGADAAQHNTIRDGIYRRTAPEDYTGDEAFRIAPLTGVLYSRGVREFTITFNPRLAVAYDSMAFLEVTGLPSRLPLTLCGHGIGPKCVLEFNRLDIGDVYLHALHEYTMSMENPSSIECQYIIMPPLPITTAAAAAATSLGDTPTRTPGGTDASVSANSFASKFDFNPSHGTLSPGEKIQLHIYLQSDRIGCFAEKFRIHMQGSLEETPLLLRGRVLGPHFHCDVEELDFGNVSYNMTHHRTMHISNTSPIPMHYTLRVSEDCTCASDFDIEPSTGIIEPTATQEVSVTFHSRTVGHYDTALLVEVADVGDVLDSIPLKATCMVPPLSSNTTEIVFGGVFVGHPSTRTVSVLNESALTGMFVLELVGGAALSDVVHVELPASVEHSDGVHWIAPHQTAQLPVTLTALRPGKLHFSIALRVLGMEDANAPSKTILVSAVASGPHVEMQPGSFQFGVLDVLHEAEKELLLKNTSPVPAPFSLAFDRYGSLSTMASTAATEDTSTASGGPPLAALPFPYVPVFRVEPSSGVLEPHSSLTVRICAKPDDAITFTDTLRLCHASTTGDAGATDDAVNTESAPLVTVKVAGRGIPIVPGQPIDLVELGDVLTATTVTETITLHNYGRRDQEVQWQNTRGTKAKEGEPPLTFTYRPERASIPARGSLSFILSGSSEEAGVRSDTFTLKQSGTFKEILRSVASATFTVPSLSCSTRTIQFEFANSENLQPLPFLPQTSEAAQSLVKSLAVKNISGKTLVVIPRIKSAAAPSSSSSVPHAASAKASVAASCLAPFELECPTSITLDPGDSYVIGVRCNPFYRGDFTSHVAKSRIQLSFARHARKEYVNLNAVLRFPSLSIEPSSLLEFGAVLRHTEQRRTIVLSNPSADLPAHFEWALRPPGVVARSFESDGDAGHAVAAGTADGPHSPERYASVQPAADGAAEAAVKRFDIVPFTGTLQPGESRNVEVGYQGTESGTALATAVCRVRGGPTYTLDVRATSNVVHAHCDRTDINFGRLPYYESATQVVMLSNSTLVPVNWEVDFGSIRHAECVRVSPMSGVLRDKVRVLITFTPTVPDVFDETLWLRIGHLDPQPIHLRGSGYLNRLMITTTSRSALVGENEVRVYRAPFRAFTEALHYVESNPSELPQRSAYNTRTVMVAPTTSTAANAPSIPAVVQKEWLTLEAERLAFCSAVSTAATSMPAMLQLSDNSLSECVEGAGEEQPLFPPTRALRRASSTAVGGKDSSGAGVEKFVLARYIVDFGHLTRHDVRKVKLYLTNTSATETVNAMLDGKELEQLPVSVSPIKGIKVAPFETVALDVVMDATKPESLVHHGENRFDFAIDIRRGPAIVVECRCYVATPNLKVTEKEVHFGPVLLGEVKVLPLTLTNPEAVSCPWRVSCKEGQGSDLSGFSPPSTRLLREGRTTPSSKTTGGEEGRGGSRVQKSGGGCATAPQFWVKRDRGIVPASGTTTIEVYFAPNSFAAGSGEGGGDTQATATLRFRCGSGPSESVLTVKLSGSARQLQVSLSTTQLRFPPVRPHQVLHESVTLVNNEEFPVEVYSVELDTQLAHEVKLLRRAMEVAPDHELFLPHMAAGDNLPHSLLESIFARLHVASEALKETPPVVETVAPEVEPLAVPKAGKSSRGQSLTAPPRNTGGAAKGGQRDSARNKRQSLMNATGTGERGLGDASDAQERLASVFAAEGGANGQSAASPSVILFVGPPHSGKTLLAQHMAAAADTWTAINVNIDELIRGEAARDDTANGAVARFLLTHQSESLTRSAPAGLAATVTEATTAVEASTASFLACTQKLVRDTLHSYLTQCMSNLAMGKPSSPNAHGAAGGRTIRFLLDGLACAVLQNPWKLFEIIQETCAGLHMPLRIVSLGVSAPMSGFRRAEALEAHHASRVAESSLTLLSEAAFEALDKKARDEYTRRLKHFNDCRREMQAAQQLKEKYAAQLPQKPVQREMEEALAQSSLEGLQGSALESTTRSARQGKQGAGGGGGGRGVSPTLEELRLSQEPKWAELDAHARFREWYSRFLAKYGNPPPMEGEGGGDTPTTSVSTAPTAHALKGAAAAAATAAAQEKLLAWANVVRVSTEAVTPNKVSELVESQLAKDTSSRATAETEADNTISLSQQSLHPLGGEAETTSLVGPPGDDAFAVEPRRPADVALSTLDTDPACTSQLGEWFYLNEGRLRLYTEEKPNNGDASSSARGRPLSAEEVLSPKMTVAVAALAAAADAQIPLDTVATRSLTDGATGEARTSSPSPVHYVHFFSTLERDVIPAKKSGARKRSIPSVILQKEEMTRWWLPPQTSVTVTLEFCSDHVGPYLSKYLFGIVGTLQQLSLTVSAMVALSDISRDPKDIFPVVRSRVTSMVGNLDSVRRTPKMYVASKKLFDFGPLLIPPPQAPKGRRRSAEKINAASSSTTNLTGRGVGGGANVLSLRSLRNDGVPGEETLTFLNKEASDAEVTLSFLNEKEKTFSVSPTTFLLNPGASQQVVLRAAPEKVGEFTNALLACIKDNPVPWKVDVRCTGVRPTLTVNGCRELEVEFGRLVLNRSVVKSFELRNEGPLPLQWKLVAAVETGTGRGANSSATSIPSVGSSAASAVTAAQQLSELQCSVLEGIIEEFGSQTLTMTFAPTHPCFLTRNVVFVVSDTLPHQQIIYELVPMVLKAEGYDVVLEWTREIQLGVLHVGEEKRETIRILNKSPYDVGYQLKLPKRLQRTVTVSHPSGILRGMVGHKDAAVANVDVVARFEKEGELPAKLSLIEAAFFDVEKRELLYPVQTIPVTGEAWYTKYTVQPPSVNFGSCMVGQPRESTFELRNTGRFPLEYVLFNYREALAAAEAGETSSSAMLASAMGESGTTSFGAGAASGASAPSGARRSLKQAKVTDLDIVVGAFTCRPFRGVVPEGGSQTITVVTVPGKQNRTRETVGVRVGQSGPELERYGTPVEVSAYPALPSIAADLTSSADVETIFEEQRIVYRLDQLAKGVRAYSKEERLFSFGTSLVGRRSEERFRIANSSPLPCTVVAQLEGASVIVGGGGGGGGMGGGGAGAGGSGAANSSRRSVVNVGGGGANGSGGRLEGFDLSLDGGGTAQAQSKTATVTMVLPPYESRFLIVGFTAGSLRRLQAQLVATVRGSGLGNDEVGESGQQLRFALCGEGTLPSVEVDLPPRLCNNAWSDMGGSRPLGASMNSSDRLYRRTESNVSTNSDRKRPPRRGVTGSGGAFSPSSYTRVEGFAANAVTGEVLELPLARVGAITSRTFTVRNTGCVTATVHLELLLPDGEGGKGSAPPSALSLNTSASTALKPRATGTHHQMNLHVSPGQAEVVEVTYAPTVVESMAMRLRVQLQDNPFEDKELQVIAHSFASPISFDGIDDACADFFDVGDCWIGVDKSCMFTLRNNTNTLVRYEWECGDVGVRMIPSVGHLGAGLTRQMTAVVHSDGQNVQQLVRCQVNVQSIQLLNNALSAGGTAAMTPLLPSSGAGAAMVGGGAGGNATVPGSTNAAITAWDNSMESPRWVLREDEAVTSAATSGVHSAAATAAFLSTAASMVGRRNLKQVMEAVPEPPCVLTDTVKVVQPLTLGYRCSVPTYMCQLLDTSTGVLKDLKAISFELTYLMQKRVTTMRVTNTGVVGLPFSYRIATSGDGEAASAAPAVVAVAGELWNAPLSEATTTAQRHENRAMAGGSWLSSPPNAIVTGEDDGEGITESPSYTAPTADFAVVRGPSTTAGSSSDAITVPSGSHVDLQVEFTPRTVGLITSEMILSFPQSESSMMRVPLQGVAECPLVHFHVPPSNAANLRSAVASGSISAAAPGQERVVVEFLARGLHTKATVKFPVINPTSTAYNFEWVEDGALGGRAAAAGGGGGLLGSGGGHSVSPFRCLTPMGAIAAGRQVDATFEFFADALGVREGSWSFQIPGRAAIPFTLIGTAVEPNVYLHVSKMNFGHVQVGTQVERTVILENCDDVAFAYAWDKLSMEGTSSFLWVKPLRGTIAPHECLSVTIGFNPPDEVEYNVPLRCAVKRSSVPLSINVKGVGVNVHDALQVEPTEDGAEPTIITRGQPLCLNLERVQVNSTVVRRFALRNNGSHSFHYSVEGPEHDAIQLIGAVGDVEAKQTAVVEFHYHPTFEETLRQCRLVFRIEEKVAYKVNLKASAYLPRLQLSFERYDFGPRFISAYNNGLLPLPSDGASVTRGVAGMGNATAVLQLTNTEAEIVTVDCGLSAVNAWCRLDCTTLVVRPKETARLRMSFVPSEVRHYEDNLRLRFNSLHTIFIPIVGEGVIPRVEVANPYAKLGVVRVGEMRQLEVKLQCLSKIPTPISFAQAIDDDLLRKGICVLLPGQTPASAAANPPSLYMKPKESAVVSLTFTPTQRMGEFSREVKMLVCGVEMPFVSVSGSCADAEVHLDTSILVFHDVIVGASATRRVTILNSGDVSQKFSWASGLQKLRPLGEWSISPVSGYVRAHTELGCELRYTPGAPGKANPKAPTMAAAAVAGTTTTPAAPTLPALPQPPSAASPLPTGPFRQLLMLELESASEIALNVESSCVTRPTPTETVQFSCRARETDVKALEVYNPTENPWTMEPVLDSTLWTCPAQLSLQPKAKTKLHVTYQPLRPTASLPASGASTATNTAAGGKARARGNSVRNVAPTPKDTATLFIPLPDGTGRCVTLEGTAEPAGSSAPLQEIDGVAQVSLPLRFQVRNWSTTDQVRFRREIEWLSVSRAGDADDTDVAEQISTLMRIEDEETVPRSTRPIKKASMMRGNSRESVVSGPAGLPAPAYIEVAPGSSRESLLKVTPLREGIYRGVLRFVPVDKPAAAGTGDNVQYYEFVIRVRPAEAAAPTMVNLHAAIRESASFSIPLANPLSKPAVFSLRLGAADGSPVPPSVTAATLDALTFPSSVTVPAHSHAQAPVQFFPLVAKKPMTVHCFLTSTDLGVNTPYIFCLSTTGETAAPEQATRLVCSLGQHINFPLRFTSYSKVNTEFAIRVGGEPLGKASTTFTRVTTGANGQGPVVKVTACPQPTTTHSSPIPKGQEVAVEFSFEPAEMGEATETIEFVSPVAGVYTFPILTSCTPPERQGPFVARAGQNLQLPFKNVFSDAVTLTVTSDSTSFVPLRKSDTIAAHKAAAVLIQCKPEDGVEVTRGRITLSCVPPGKHAPNLPAPQPIQWVYYVEAVNANDGTTTSKQAKGKR